MKIALFGGSGGLGSKVMDALVDKEYSVYNPTSKQVDVKNQFHVQDFLKQQFDVVINLTGYNYDAMAHKYPVAEVEKQIVTNIYGTTNIVSAALNMMRKQGHGRIILISSVLSEKVVPGTSVYAGCKAFIDQYAKVVSAENIGKHITCNTIQLGYFDGGMTDRLPDKESAIKRIGLGRLGTIEELVSTIEFIIHNEYLTGTAIQINGGIS
jgi:3-oxoacyl-[acyl-carrier protein] reductase